MSLPYKGSGKLKVYCVTECFLLHFLWNFEGEILGEEREWSARASIVGVEDKSLGGGGGVRGV